MDRWGRDERGAAAVIVAVLMSAVLFVSAAFAVDLGMQRDVRRDVQAIADVVALDLARMLTGKPANQYSTSAIDTAKNESLARNQDAVGGALSSSDVSWEFVNWNATGGRWDTVPKTSTTVPTAVRVTAASDVGFALSGFTHVDRGGAVRVAVASADKSACFRVGSFIASLNTADSALLNPLLGGLLGSNLSLDAVSYQGLANLSVTLADLVSVPGLGVGTVDQLVNLQSVKVADLFLAAANVLDKQGHAAQATILRNIQVAANTPNISIAALLNAGPTDQAALDTQINVLDLITGAALLADKNHAVDVPNLGISLPGVANTTTTLTVIEAPQPGCNDKPAQTAQVKLDLTAHVNQQSVSVPALGTTVTVAPVDIHVSLNLGKAIAQLESVTCTNGIPDSIQVQLRSAVLGSLSLTATAGLTADFTIPLLGSNSLLQQVLSLLGLNLLNLLLPPEVIVNTSVSAGAVAPGATEFNKHLTIPIPGGYTTPVGGGPGDVLAPLATMNSANASVSLKYWTLTGAHTQTVSAGGLFTTIFNALDGVVSGIVNPLVSTLQTALITPLEDLLGLQLSGARVFAERTPTCGLPRLVG